jgi:PAS domain S-box-containing protein
MTSEELDREQLLDLIDAAPVLLRATDANGSCSFLSRGWYEFTGKTRDESLGFEWLDSVHPEDREAVRRHFFPTIIQQKKSFAIEYRLRHADKSHRWVFDTGSPRFSQASEFLGHAGNILDINDRKQAEAGQERLLQILESERERLDDLFQRSPSLMCILSGPDHVFERANDRYLEIVGHRDIIGKPLREALPEVVDQGFLALLDTVYQTGEAYVGTDARVLLQQRPGESADERYVDFVYQALRAPDGEVTGIFVQGIDGTRRKRAETALRSKDEQLDLLIGNLRDYAIIIFDPSGTILEWYGGAEHITGFTAREAIGQKGHIIFTPEDNAIGQVEREMAAARQDGKAEDRRWHQRKDGSRFFANGTMTPLYDQGGILHGFGKVFRDETEMEREADRRTLLLAVARYILEAPPTAGPLSEQVFEMIRGQLGADILFSYKLDHDGSLRLVAGIGIPEALQETAMRVEAGQACCEAVAPAPEPIAAGSNHVAADPAWGLASRIGARAYVCHPLLGWDGRVLGTFSVASRRRDSFAPGEVQFLQTVSHFLALAWDRQEVEAALVQVTTESERHRRLYETILASTPDLVYVFDLNHRFTYANEILLRMWGRTWEDAIGKNCLELGYEPWHAEMHDREIEQVKATRQPIRGEVPFTGTFGRRIYDYIFVPVLGPDGEVEAVAGTTRDVTERKQSEEEVTALLAKEKRRSAVLARVAEATKSMAVALSVDSIVSILAAEAKSILGARHAVTSPGVPDSRAQTADEMPLDMQAGHSLEPGARPERQAPAREGLGKLAEDGVPMRSWLAVPLVGHGGKKLGSIALTGKHDGEFTDEDEAVLVQLAAIASAGIENARLYEQLREQDRRKDEFLATLAHELRNPLAPIRTGLTLLNMAPSLAATVKTREIMGRQVEHMVRLIDDLLEVSRITSGKIQLKKEYLDVGAILDSALEVSRPLIEAGRHELFVSASQEPLPRQCRLDADRAGREQSLEQRRQIYASRRENRAFG